MNDLKLFLEACRAGASDLRRHSSLLNAINVFPVVDGDTGANMSSTLEPLWKTDLDPRDLSRAIIVGARGNSGIILAQFIVGFFDHLYACESINFENTTEAISRAVKRAYGSVSEPVQGTMLTVMSKLEEIFSGHRGKFNFDDHALLEATLAKTVAHTQHQMKRLTEAGVVDAGALGFHLFACGLTLATASLNDPKAGIKIIDKRKMGTTCAPLGEIAKKINPQFLESAASDTTDYRYCVDIVVKLNREPPKNWQQQFNVIGGSIDFARSGDLLKLHVHSNNDKEIKRLASTLGSIIRVVCEDMTEGLVHRAPSSTKRTTRTEMQILGDSSMSLSKDLLKEHKIDHLDAYINVFGEMVQDKNLDQGALFAEMRRGHVFKTAQPSPEDAKIFVDDALKNSTFCLYMGVGAAYTGIQDLVQSTADKTVARDNFLTIDTRAASGQQGIATLATAIWAKKIDDRSQLIEYALNQVDSAKEYLVIDDLKYLSRSGRIGKIKAKMAHMLSIKPIVGHGGDGAITYAKARSHEAALKEITKRLITYPGEGDLLIMLEFTDNQNWIKTVRKQLEAALPSSTIFCESPLSPTSAVHMGPGTWGVAVTRT